MNELLYNCFNKNIKICLKNISIDTVCFEFWLKRDCPNIERIDFCENSNYLVMCENSIYKTESYVIENSIVLKGNFENCEAWLAKFISQIFQKLLIEDEVIFLNAACVVFNNEAILMLGDFGQGKTSTAIGICEHLNNTLLISDNYVALKENYVIGITDYISIRNENSYANNILKKNNLILDINNRGFYSIENDKNIKYSIKKIIIPFINCGDNNFHIISKEESKWYLYQKMSRLINGETLLFNGILPSPIFNNEGISKKILRISNNYLEGNNILYVSSSVEFIAKYISNILGWNNE